MKCQMLMVLCFVLACTTSCTRASEGVTPNKSTQGRRIQKLPDTHSRKFKCIEIGPSKFAVYRCHNDEIVCYFRHKDNALHCKFETTEGGY